MGRRLGSGEIQIAGRAVRVAWGEAGWRLWQRGPWGVYRRGLVSGLREDKPHPEQEAGGGYGSAGELLPSGIARGWGDLGLGPTGQRERREVSEGSRVRAAVA